MRRCREASQAGSEERAEYSVCVFSFVVCPCGICCCCWAIWRLISALQCYNNTFTLESNRVFEGAARSSSLHVSSIWYVQYMTNPTASEYQQLKGIETLLCDIPGPLKKGILHVVALHCRVALVAGHAASGSIWKHFPIYSVLLLTRAKMTLVKSSALYRE